MLLCYCGCFVDVVCEFGVLCVMFYWLMCVYGMCDCGDMFGGFLVLLLEFLCYVC